MNESELPVNYSMRVQGVIGFGFHWLKKLGQDYN